VPLILVTGIPGAGKSSVLAELRSRGYEAYGADEDHWGRWEDGETHEVVATNTTAEMRTALWRSRHEWRASRSVIEELAKRASEASIFLCGYVTNEDEIWDLFSRHIYLDIDEATLRQRIASRTDNDFGKSDRELVEILERHADAANSYKKADVIVIDATQPIKVVVDEVEAAINGR
jgi:shikimate kinase